MNSLFLKNHIHANTWCEKYDNKLQTKQIKIYFRHLPSTLLQSQALTVDTNEM